MNKISNPLTKKFEFETGQGYLADKFLIILEVFNIYPEDVYIPSFLDMSNIEFWTTKKKKDQIEYVFKRFIKEESHKINKSITELEGGDWFAIF